MVDVGHKPAERRRAVACGELRCHPDTVRALRERALPKGDVLTVAKLAGIQAAKRTDELIPLCHSLPLDGVDVTFRVEPDRIEIRAEASTSARTGVEMEALTAVQVGLLTLYDMLKSVDPAMSIGPVRLLRKSGGRHGDWSRG